MGLLKDLGKLAGAVTGVVIAAPVYLAGEIVNSDFIKEVAETAYKVTESTGTAVGSIAEGTTYCVFGAIEKDNQKMKDGFSQVVDTGVNTVVGMGKGMINVADKGLTTVGAILAGDQEQAIKAGKELVKVACVSALAVGMADVIDGVIENDVAFDSDVDDDYELVENPNMHHVSPHYRTLPDGREIWVDGDGNTNIDTYEGWKQHNPDYRV